MSDAENPTPTPADAWNAVFVASNAIYLEMARAGVVDHAAAEQRLIEIQRQLGLIEITCANLPAPYPTVSEAILAEIDMHHVVFARAGERGDATPSNQAGKPLDDFTDREISVAVRTRMHLVALIDMGAGLHLPHESDLLAGVRVLAQAGLVRVLMGSNPDFVTVTFLKPANANERGGK